jgi:hypothetical protein
MSSRESQKGLEEPIGNQRTEQCTGKDYDTILVCKEHLTQSPSNRSSSPLRPPTRPTTYSRFFHPLYLVMTHRQSTS